MKHPLSCLIIFSLFSQLNAQTIDLLGVGSTPQAASGVAQGQAFNDPCVKGGIVRRWDSPASNPLDLAFDGVNLWLSGFQSFVFHQINPLTGAVIRTIPTNIGNPSGLTFDGNDLWVMDSESQVLQRVDTANGAVLSIMFSPRPAGFGTGLAWDGVGLWNNDVGSVFSLTAPDSIYRLSTTGTVLLRSNQPTPFPSGLAFDGTYPWFCDNFTNRIYQLDPVTFTLLDSLNAPGGNFPNGLTYDGEFLWVANNDQDSIYQIRITDFVAPLTLLEADICEGDSIFLGGSFQFTAGIYRDTVTGSSGCDSLLETTLTVLPSFPRTDSLAVCSGDSYTFPDGTTQSNITSPLSYTSVFVTEDGCDSSVLTVINVLPVFEEAMVDTVCEGGNYTFPDGSVVEDVMTDTSYLSVLPTVNGCDSSVTTNLAVRVLETAVTQVGNVLSSQATSGSYQWIRCEGGKRS